MVQVRNGGDSDYRGSGGDGETCLDFRNILKVQSTSFVKVLNVGCKSED